MTRLKRALWLILPAVFLVPLGACVPGATSPSVLPAPTDNQVRIEVEATHLTPDGPKVVAENYIDIIVNTFDAAKPPVPLVGDDGKPLANWSAGPSSSIPGKPWSITLSQAPGVGGGVVAGSIRVLSAANSHIHNALAINCRFFVAVSPLSGGDGLFHEAPQFFQTNTGRQVSCLFSFTFQH